MKTGKLTQAAITEAIVCGDLSVGECVAAAAAAQEEPERIKAILDLAKESDLVDNDGGVEVDDMAIVSEGEDNGAYVSAWVWVGFGGTSLTKECDLCFQDMEEAAVKINDEWVCSGCAKEYEKIHAE